MHVFKIIRLGLWSIILAGCLIIGSFYLSLQQTFLAGDRLNQIVADSDVAATVREEVLLPKVLQTTRASVYSSLLDDKTVTTAFNEAVSTDVLQKKLEPATAATQAWLNNQADSIEFAIDMSDISDSFAHTLAKEVDAKMAALPRCTLRNSLDDAEQGRCRSALVSSSVLTQKVKELVSRDQTLAGNTTLTPDSVQLSAAIKQRGSNLPDYLNLLYALALVSAGFALVIIIWLGAKHRLAGAVTIGISSLLASLGLFIGAIIGTQAVGVLSTDSRIQQIARTGASALEATLHHYALILAVAGSVLCVVATVLIVMRRRKGRQAVQFGSHT